MDTLFWLPNWEHLENDEFLFLLEAHLEKASWVLDGNQSKTNHLKWQYVDTIIWLDYSFYHTFKQIVVRSIKRSFSQKELWAGTGNTESFRRNFFSSDSVILWMLQNYWKTKRKYATLFASQTLKDVRLVRLTSPQQAEQFLANV